MLIVQGLTNLLPADLRDIKDVAIGLKDAQVVNDEIKATNIDSNAPTRARSTACTSRSYTSRRVRFSCGDSRTSAPTSGTR